MSADLVMLATGLVGTGLAAGLVAGMLGVGGGIVIVPVLYLVLGAVGVSGDYRMHLAVGTSLATILPTSLASLRAHHAHGAVDWALLKRWAPPMIAGVIAGTLLAGAASGRLLTLVFALVAIPVALNMAFGKEHWHLADELPRGPAGWTLPSAIGGVSAMMGIGGGTLGVPLLSLCNYPIHHAVGTASAFGLIISVPGTIGMVLGGWGAEGLPAWSLGYVSALGFILIAPMSTLMAPVGARLAHSFDRARLRILFAVFIAFTAARMLQNALA